MTVVNYTAFHWMVKWDDYNHLRFCCPGNQLTSPHTRRKAKGNYHNEMTLSLSENCLEIATYQGSTYSGQQGRVWLLFSPFDCQSAPLTTTSNQNVLRNFGGGACTVKWVSIVPEWVLDLSVVEGVNHYFSDNVAEGDHEEGEQEKHDRVEEGVERQC